MAQDTWRQNVRLMADETSHQFLRVETELKYARWLAEKNPSKRAAWQKLIDKAEADFASAVAADARLAAVKSAAQGVEKTLSPLGAAAKEYTVHLVGHGHIDMNWMWSWPETVGATLDTMRTVLRLMEEYPQFTFSQSQATIYQILQQHAPDLLEKVAGHVKTGRWEVTASHWVEGDKNIVGGESLTRHLLYTRQYMQELFGLKAEDVNIDWAPDTFGHSVMVPAYLNRGGVKFMYTHRPGIHTKNPPEVFWWDGPEGSRLLVRNDQCNGYNGRITPELSDLLARYSNASGLKDFMFVHGLGDHGGGPTRHDLLWAQELMTWPIFPALVYTTARKWFETIQAKADKLPVLSGELNTEFTGCYTTQTLIKRANRVSENRLLDAEFASAVAWGAAGDAYPATMYRDAWRDMLFNHFHDILPGSGIRDTRTYTHGLFQKQMAFTGSQQAKDLRLLASCIDTQKVGPGHPNASYHVGAGVGNQTAEGAMTTVSQSNKPGVHPVVVFNTIGIDRHEVVHATIWDNTIPNALSAVPIPLKDRQLTVTDAAGNSIPHQVLWQGSNWGHDAATLAFVAQVPAHGYAFYSINETMPATLPIPATHNGHTTLAKGIVAANKASLAPMIPGQARQTGFVLYCFYAPPECTEEGLENDLLRVRIDPATGAILSLIDKQTGREIITPDRPAGLQYTCELPHGMSAWSIGHMVPPQALTLKKIKRLRNGPVCAAISADLEVGPSRFTIIYELRAGEKQLHVHIKGQWCHAGNWEVGVPGLRLNVPLALNEVHGEYEIPFGSIHRELANGHELPALSWAQFTGKASSVAMAGKSDGKSAGKTTRGEALATAGLLVATDCKHGFSIEDNTVRLTLIRASYEPDPSPELGEHEMKITLQPVGDPVGVAQATAVGASLNRPLVVVNTDVHAGQWPAAGQLLNVAPAEVVVSGIKRAEDGQGLIVRLYNTTGRSVQAKVSLPADQWKPIRTVNAVDLNEQLIAKRPALKFADRKVTVPMEAFDIQSIKIGW